MTFTKRGPEGHWSMAKVHRKGEPRVGREVSKLLFCHTLRPPECPLLCQMYHIDEKRYSESLSCFLSHIFYNFCLDFSNVLKHNGQYETAYHDAAFSSGAMSLLKETASARRFALRESQRTQSFGCSENSAARVLHITTRPSATFAYAVCSVTRFGSLSAQKQRT